MIQYVLECIAFQLVFLIIYDFFLKRETFFQWNRVYLIGTYTLSMVLPWIKIEALKNAVPKQYYIYPEYLWGTNDAVTAVSEGSSLTVSWEYIPLFGGMLFAALLFGFKMWQLYGIRKNGEVHFFKDFTKIIISNSSSAFSFFKSIFMGDKILESEHENIIRHELVHIRQRHSWDLLFFEMMRIVGWFNPLVYVYQGRISELHEFIADSHVAKTDKKEQYQLLLSKVFQTQKISFINQFFKSSLIKKRIVMLQKSKSKRIFQLKYLFLIPVVTAMLFYSSCQNEMADEPNIIFVDNIERLTSDEEQKVFDRLIGLSKNSKGWQLYVKDGSSTMKFIPSFNESYISGPNNQKIYAKLAIDSKLSGSNSLDIEDFLSKNTMSTTVKYNELMMERKRLLQNINEQDPIIVNLDEQLKHLKKSILGNDDGTVPFGLVDDVPIFPGCEGEKDKRNCFKEKIMRHIQKHFNYPQEAEEKGVEGRVNIVFTIDKEGNIVNITKRGPNKLLENEAARIIKRLPKMVAGRYGNKNVNVPFSMPITFKLR